MADWRARSRDTAGFGHVHRDAQRDCRAVYSAILLPRRQCLHEPDCLHFIYGVRKPALPAGVHGTAQTAAGRELASGVNFPLRNAQFPPQSGHISATTSTKVEFTKTGI